MVTDTGLKIPEIAKLLQVTERTVYAWISGKAAVPYAAYKLLRLLRWFELPSPWDGWTMHSGKLWSPEGQGFTPSDSAWWGVLVRKAAQFDGMVRLNDKLQAQVSELASRLQRGGADDAQCRHAQLAAGAASATAGSGEVPVTLHFSANGGTPAPRPEVLVTPQASLTGETPAPGSQEVTVLVTRHKRLKNEPERSCEPGSAAGGEVLVTPHDRAKNGAPREFVQPDWTVDNVSRRWFNYDRGQPYRGAK